MNKAVEIYQAIENLRSGKILSAKGSNQRIRQLAKTVPKGSKFFAFLQSAYRLSRQITNRRSNNSLGSPLIEIEYDKFTQLFSELSK